jgi:ABC-2 type transport system permease protein
MTRTARLSAFVRRDLRLARSYRAAFVGQFLGIALFLATFGLMGSVVRGDFADRFGADYFAFAAVGIAVSGALVAALTAFGGALREAQLDGTLEAVLTTPAPQEETVALLGAYPLLSGFLGGIVTLAGAALFGASYHIDPIALVLAAVLSIGAFAALGLLTAAGVLIAKRGSPVAGLLGMAGTVAAGAYVPTSTFPRWLQAIASVNPMTYALRAWRGALLEAQSPASIGPSLAVLAVLAIVGLPLALTVLRRAIDLARAEGTLATY